MPAPIVVLLLPLLKRFIRKRLEKRMLQKLKELILVKLGLGTSATMGVAAMIMAFGVAYQTNPETQAFVNSMIPDSYEGLFVSLIGVVVAVARFRTLSK